MRIQPFISLQTGRVHITRLVLFSGSSSCSLVVSDTSYFWKVTSVAKSVEERDQLVFSVGRPKSIFYIHLQPSPQTRMISNTARDLDLDPCPNNRCFRTLEHGKGARLAAATTHAVSLPPSPRLPRPDVTSVFRLLALEVRRAENWSSLQEDRRVFQKNEPSLPQLNVASDGNNIPPKPRRIYIEHPGRAMQQNWQYLVPKNIMPNKN